MLLNTRPATGGKHRKVSPSRTKGRVALVAAVASTVSSAGVGAAAAATLSSQQDSEAPGITDVDLVNDTDALPANQAGEAEAAAPQILTINEYKPAHDLNAQLDKAVDFSNQRTAEAKAEADRIAAEIAAAEQAAAAEAEKARLEALGITTDYITGAAVVKPAQGVFTSGYGPRWGTLHAGIDIANVVGTPILAAMAGTVIDSGPAQGYGQWIRIRHDDGSMTLYGHMETLNVSVGERVVAGQQIAGMGNRGFSTGPHLHFEYHPTGNGAVDPVPWFAANGITI
ncbi:M23 family metallopeptidase [Corynebacterium cystitidis]|uniref:Murein DD-endopeptidase MepM and murein hydrolase activator NlpD, contain LysM domain n=1 Tax=Corynebacterium cystitidis DSM 20524 TaxID=1121357 RepID=A0A1H9T7V9_9CORY|nr:M23 family metallopeptidase [Corynebacterium cystitidis]WJY83495.1 Glycyl-glycine endopeptidase ALE-1 precursor [Corynebacterium cystitidis DSM 20524]SER93325.1 Murein DD-endopeptidase MepM and murein hydrolase activator NlpD, contain LysM domain [Corynebacterium cystitidis DSM 20524]SNV92490.1 metallopeptidase [Corynebacterium cystitidis]